MSGPPSPTAPSPTNSATSTVGLPTDEGLISQLEVDETLAAFAESFGFVQSLPPSEIAAAWILDLRAGGEMPTREQLIELLHALREQLLQRERSLQALTVTGGALGAVNANAADAFLRVELDPHLMLPGDKLEQCQSKMTKVVVRLVNGQGQPIHGATLQTGGLKLKVTLINNTTGETIHLNPKKPTQALLTGSADRAYDPCAAANACFL